MKLLTTNFLTCAVKACKSSPASFPLHFKDAVVDRTAVAYNPVFMANILPRLNWDAMRTTAAELGLGAALPPEPPSLFGQSSATGGVAPGLGPEEGEKGKENDARPGGEDEDGMDIEESAAATVDRDETATATTTTRDQEAMLKKLHGLLLETAVSEGKLVCGNCGFEYPIKDGVGNFLLPAHLV